MGQFEVTQGQWEAVMGALPAEFVDCGPECPVENVSWDDCQQFLRKLNALLEHPAAVNVEAGQGLPIEVEGYVERSLAHKR